MRHLMLALSLAACGDNLRPPADAPSDAGVDAPAPTWRDAMTAFADAWCGVVLRCDPGQYAAAFPDGLPGCERYVLDLEAPGYGDLYPEPYPPDRAEVLRSCARDLAELACGSADLPATCLAAFEAP